MIDEFVRSNAPKREVGSEEDEYQRGKIERYTLEKISSLIQALGLEREGELETSYKKLVKLSRAVYFICFFFESIQTMNLSPEIESTNRYSSFLMAQKTIEMTIANVRNSEIEIANEVADEMQTAWDQFKAKAAELDEKDLQKTKALA